jgi:hypothetical protein
VVVEVCVVVDVWVVDTDFECDVLLDDGAAVATKFAASSASEVVPRIVKERRWINRKDLRKAWQI